MADALVSIGPPCARTPTRCAPACLMRSAHLCGRVLLASPAAAARRPTSSTPTAPRGDPRRDAAAGASAARLARVRARPAAQRRQRSGHAASRARTSRTCAACTVALPGTVDSSPIYLHGVSVGGRQPRRDRRHDHLRRTIAIDADSGRILWTFTPARLRGWAGSAQITTASPIADPDRRFVYAASPNGLIHKLSLADGGEDRAGLAGERHPRRHPREARGGAEHRRPDVIATTGGYFGDAPPYQGHVVLIVAPSGRLRAVFNTLCANRRELLVPSSCPASDSAILSRGGRGGRAGRRADPDRHRQRPVERDAPTSATACSS